MLGQWLTQVYKVQIGLSIQLWGTPAVLASTTQNIGWMPLCHNGWAFHYDTIEDGQNKTSHRLFSNRYPGPDMNIFSLASCWKMRVCFFLLRLDRWGKHFGNIILASLFYKTLRNKLQAIENRMLYKLCCRLICSLRCKTGEQSWYCQHFFPTNPWISSGTLLLNECKLRYKYFIL